MVFLFLLFWFVLLFLCVFSCRRSIKYLRPGKKNWCSRWKVYAMTPTASIPFLFFFDIQMVWLILDVLYPRYWRVGTFGVLGKNEEASSYWMHCVFMRSKISRRSIIFCLFCICFWFRSSIYRLSWTDRRTALRIVPLNNEQRTFSVEVNTKKRKQVNFSSFFLFLFSLYKKTIHLIFINFINNHVLLVLPFFHSFVSDILIDNRSSLQ